MENAISAHARRIEISLSLDADKDMLRIIIADDGVGMPTEMLAKVRDPFYTTKDKRTGLGIPFLVQAAEQAGGKVTIQSTHGKGTRVMATFQWSHIDRPAVGSVADTLVTLIVGHPDIDFLYVERKGERTFVFDTAEIKAELQDVPINTPAAIEAIKRMLNENVIIAER